MTGKLADTVMSVRNGEQIARKYQPVVFNPSTPAQVAQRAKMKLISQLSAIFADLIAFRREGAVSARNIFTKKNIGQATYADNEASFNMNGLDLTGGVLGCSVLASRGPDGIGATAYIPTDVNRVVFAYFRNNADGSLTLVGKNVVSNAGNSSVNDTLAGTYNEKIYVIAYGIRDNSEAARTSFGNVTVPTTDVNAVLTVVRNLTSQDVSLTATGVTEIAANPEP